MHHPRSQGKPECGPSSSVLHLLFKLLNTAICVESLTLSFRGNVFFSRWSALQFYRDFKILLQHSNFALGLFLDYSVGDTVINNSGVSVWSTGILEKTTEPMLFKASGRQVIGSQLRGISPQLHGRGDLISIFSLNLHWLSCLSFIGEPLASDLVPSFHLSLGLTLHSTLSLFLSTIQLPFPFSLCFTVGSQCQVPVYQPGYPILWSLTFLRQVVSTSYS